MGMTSRQRMLTALEGGVPDRLPVTTHHLQDYFRNKYMGGKSDGEIFAALGLDPIFWTGPYLPDVERGAYFDPTYEEPTNPRFSRRIVTDEWQIQCEPIDNPRYSTQRCTIATPKGNLTMVLQSNEYTLSLIHISEPTRPFTLSRMPSSA